MKELVEYYDNLSRTYDELYGQEQVVKYLKASAHIIGDRILDAGCGTGLGAALLRPRYVVCVDISRGMLERARSRGLDVLMADVRLLPLRPKSFDTALAITVFENISDARILSTYADVVVAETLGVWLVLKSDE
ncbi:MAG: methyltransferase domain-containing protein [Thermoproteus sp.]